MSNSTMLNAQPTTPVPKKSWLSWNLAGLLLLAVSFIVSLVSLVRVRAELFDPEVKVVRLLHWQLELGFRDALQTVIDDFNRMKDEEFKAGKIPKRIKVVQLGVTEKVYGQFLNTHLIAGTAPDICALGMASSTWGSTKAQFFEQFTDVLEQPNPYNARAFDDGAGLDPELKAALPNMPWKSTFVEGLQSGWDGELQGYYGVPPLIFTANRISVNLDMLKAATGSERLPTSLGEFLAAANAIRELGTRTGSDIVPVAGSRYSQSFWGALIAPYFATFQDKLDRNLDGEIDETEGWAGVKSGVFKLDGPEMETFAKSIRAVTETFPNGFAAMERDNATFMFVQGRAGMHFTGSWDAGTLAKLSAGKFRIGVIKLPTPAAGEPFGDPVKPPTNETAQTGGGCYSITKGSHVKDEALDFLRYWTSRKVNERMNMACEWLPSIVGSQTGTVIAPYQPTLSGTHPAVGWMPAAGGNGAGSKMRDVASGQILGIAGGESDWNHMREKVAKAYQDEYIGEPAIWKALAEAAPDRARIFQRNLAPHALRQVLRPGPRTERSVQNLIFNLHAPFSGRIPQLTWRAVANGEAYPEKQP